MYFQPIVHKEDLAGVLAWVLAGTLPGAPGILPGTLPGILPGAPGILPGTLPGAPGILPGTPGTLPVTHFQIVLYPVRILRHFPIHVHLHHRHHQMYLKYQTVHFLNQEQPAI